MSTENTPDEKELWASIPRSEGVDRAEHFVTLSHMAYDRGGFKSALALCESAREIYESHKATVGTQRRRKSYSSKAKSRLMEGLQSSC